MKQVKVKKIKKIPKYAGGTGNAGTSVLNTMASSYTPFSGSISKAPAGGNLTGSPTITPGGKSTGNNYGGGVGTQSMPSFNGISALNTGIGVAAAASQPIASALGIEQGKAGQLVGGVGKAVGLINPVAGLAIETVAPFLGGTGHVNYDQITTTGNAKKAVLKRSGILGVLFGKDSDQLYVDANQYQNSLVAAELTTNKQLEWANDPRNQGMISTLKEGGFVPGEHYASRLEVETDNNGNNAVRYAWDPNGKDTYHIYTNPDGSSAEGNMIFNEEGVKRPNGMKYSDTAEKIIKNIKDPKLKKISLKKLAAEQEVEKAKEGKTKNGIPAYGDGDDGKKELSSSMFDQRNRNSVLGRWLRDYDKGQESRRDRAIRQFLEFVENGGEYRTNKKGGVEVKHSDGKWYRYVDSFDFDSRDLASIHRNASAEFITPEVLKKALYVKGNYGISIPERERVEINKNIIQNVNRALSVYNPGDFYNISSEPTPVEDTGKTENTSASAKKVSTSSVASSNSTTNIPSYAPFLSKKSAKDLLQRQNQYKNIESLSIIPNIPEPVRTKGIPGFMDDYGETVRYERPSNVNWEDLAYKAASILTPLFDREKAETTRLQRPTWHGIPVAVDVLNQLQDAQLGYALANYNTAQGGYTAGQQLAARGAAASNLARQRAAIHQWQTEQQNKNIAQNVTSLNAHSNVQSEIENKEIDINDANRAAARSVERQRRAEAMKNWGQVLRDKNQQAMDDMRMVMIEPLLQYAYENPEAIKKIYNKRSK